MLTAFFILSRIVANPLSNVFQKKLGMCSDSRLIIFITHVLMTLACLPALLVLRPGRLGIPFWENMALCALLAVAGNTLIVAALRSADLSVLGPLNAYKSVVGIMLGAVVLREYPSLFGMAGVAMILGGSLLILDQPGEGQEAQRHGGAAGLAARVWSQLRNRGVQLRFAALVLSAAEAVFLKKALLLSSPAITFIFWCGLGVPLAGMAAIYALRSETGRQIMAATREPKLWLLLAGTTGLMQFSTLYTFDVMQVGYSLALFQTSTLLSVLFGYRFFQEQHIARRLIGALVMIAGAVMVIRG